MAIGKQVADPLQQMSNTDTTNNWYGSVNIGWTNSKTGEKIVFKEPGVRNRRCWQVWLYKTTDKRRGQKLSRGRTKGNAIAEARKIANEYDEKSFWPITP